MEQTSLEQLIAHQEGQTLEFKREFSTDIVKEVVAFANTEGGVILIGIDDDGAVVGLEDDLQRLEERIVNLCRSRCQPAILPSIEMTQLEGKQILVVRVEEGRRKPYKANEVTYVRVGSTCRHANRDEEYRMFIESGEIVFEQTPVQGATFADLDRPKLAHYVELRAPGAVTVNQMPLERLALRLGFVCEEGEELVPTVAGLLLFGQYPQLALPQSGISAVRFLGTDLADPLLDRAEIEGTLDQLIVQAAQFVRRNERVAAVFGTDFPSRTDMPEYPIWSVREVLANAVSHRDYSVRGQRVMLRMFDDRLEVFNPGGLMPGVTLEELERMEVVPPRRNPLLVRVLREWGIVEEVGRGLTRIRREMQEHGSGEPVFRADRRSFTVILPARVIRKEELQG